MPTCGGCGSWRWARLSVPQVTAAARVRLEAHLAAAPVTWVEDMCGHSDRDGRRLPAFRLRASTCATVAGGRSSSRCFWCFPLLRFSRVVRRRHSPSGSSISCSGAGISGTGRQGTQALRLVVTGGNVVKRKVGEDVNPSRVVNRGARRCTLASERKTGHSFQAEASQAEAPSPAHHGVAVVRPSLTSLPPPAGYTDQQMIFDDQFSGGTLNADQVEYLHGKWRNHLEQLREPSSRPSRGRMPLAPVTRRRCSGPPR